MIALSGDDIREESARLLAFGLHARSYLLPIEVLTVFPGKKKKQYIEPQTIIVSEV